MSLPPLLFERLKKRGIIKNNQITNKKLCETDVEEKKEENLLIKTVNGCPNKYNIYHQCKKYCENKYGNGMEQPSLRIKKVYEALIEKYPLSDKWQEVWEPGTQRYYFWNIDNDEVSWYPPGHENFNPIVSVFKIKENQDLQATKITDHNFDSQNKFEKILKSNDESNDSDCLEKNSQFEKNEDFNKNIKD